MNAIAGGGEGRTPSSLIKLAGAMLKAGDAEGVVQMLDAAAARFPGDPDLLTIHAEALFKQKLYRPAYDAWAALGGDPARRAKLHLKMSRAAEAFGDLERAARHCRDHLASDPSDGATRNRLLALELQAAPTRAEQAARVAAHVAAYGPNPLTERLAVLAMDLPAEPEAAARVLTSDPGAYDGDPALGLKVIDALMARGLLADLAPVVESLARAVPGDLRFADRRVQVLRDSGVPRPELIEARRILAEHPKAEDKHRLRYGRACLQTMAARSLRMAEDVLSRQPADIEAVTLAIRAAHRLERNEAAADHLARALPRLAPGKDGQLTAARLFIAASRPDGVLSALRDRHEPEALLMRFNAAWEVGDYALGLRLVALSDATASDDVRARIAQMRLALRLAPGEGPIFPDVLFERALAIRREPRATGDDLAIVTSNLGAGGAERQVALTAHNIARLRADGPARTVLLARSLDPGQRHDVMLPVARHERLEIDDLSRLEPGAALAALERLGEPRSHLDLVAAFPPQIAHEIANLYLRFIEINPRVVHLWQDGRIALGSVAAALAGVPRIVASIRNVLPEANDRRRFRRYLPVLYKALGQRDDVVFSTNSQVAATEYADVVGIPVERFTVIRNGLQIESIQARVSPDAERKAREELGIGAAKLVGGVFRLAPAKRPGVWIRTAAIVAAALPEVRFVIIGDGVLRAEMEQLAVDLGLKGRIVFAGQRSPVEPWMAAMDVFLLTSSVEGLPNVLLEAQALGVPVVTTDAGGAREAMIDKVTGRLVIDDAPEHLAAAVIALLRQANTKGKSRISGPRFIASRFGVDRMIEATLRAYGMR